MSYLKVFDDLKNTLSIVAEMEGGQLLYNFMPREGRKMNSARKGTLLYPK